MVIECDDLLRFGKTEIRVRSGERITVVLKNIGRIPRMQHNWVLLKQGVNVAAFGNAAMKAADTNYIPSDMADKVIAFTEMAAPGEEKRVSFAAPEPGVYDYICSYPGHQSVSKGKLIAE